MKKEPQGKREMPRGRIIRINERAMDDIEFKIQQLINIQEYQSLIELIDYEILKAESTSHWLLANKASALYELREYGEAMEVISKALKEESACPFVWWHLANILEGNGQLEEAMTVWEEIVSYRKEKIDYELSPCWEGEDFKNGLILDSIFRIGKVLSYINETNKAIKYLKIFIKAKQETETNSSIYSIDQALEIIKQLKKD